VHNITGDNRSYSHSPSVMQGAAIFLLAIIICSTGDGLAASLETDRFKISNVYINGKTDKCGALLAGQPFTITSDISNSYSLKTATVVLKIFNSEGDTVFSYSKEAPFSADHTQIPSSTIRINSSGNYSAKLYVADLLNKSKIISNIKVIDLEVIGISDIVQPRYLYDNFSEGTYVLDNLQISPNGKWYAWYAGSEKEPGAQGVRADSNGTGNVFYSESPSPERQTLKKRTFSTLTLSTQSYRNFQLSLDVRTISQTRTSYAPNPWEVAWVFWHDVGNGTDPIDKTHFYYFLVKTNGVEIGKYDGGTNPESQKIIKSKTYPNQTTLKTDFGKWQNWNIIVIDNHIISRVNNITAFDIRDTASFGSGRIGLYNEDSRTEFRNVYVRALC